ncbi:MAG: hypothetical protein E7646_08450 [Ruminococcaceae bacterium]|nr:hypothetical protein [Oscillospiraceae bacterium]
MWFFCFLSSIACLVLAILLAFALKNNKLTKKRKISAFHCLLIGVFVASLFMFFPIHQLSADPTVGGIWRAILLSLFNSMQIFALGCEFNVVFESIGFCPEWLSLSYQVLAAALFVLAPVFTFGFMLSLFKNITAYLKFISTPKKEVFVFSELNVRSLTLAKDIKKNRNNSLIVFTDVFEDNDENVYEMIDESKNIGAVCFKKDILVIDFNKHSGKRPISFFVIGENEGENLNQSLKLIENYKKREDTHIFIFSKKIEGELLLNSVDKGFVKVRRINEVHSLINRVLYDQGNLLFDSALPLNNGKKKISAVVVGMGRHGTEMTRALTWFCQMDGYTIEINAFDKDPLAEDKFCALVPELMSEKYNGVYKQGEPEYKISVHSGLNVETKSFADAISAIGDATYVFVALGNDDVNINTAVMLRMYFERMKIHPVIQAIVYNSQQKKALKGIKNYRGQEYDIEFIGDTESSYTEKVIIDSELEEDALRRHLKWGKEEDFWTYEYNYRSSMASAIHMKARIKCNIPGANKKTEELTEEERDSIEVLEHCRWNAYMRSEGYVYSGSKDKQSRNDLGKMHHALVDFSALCDEEKRKDSEVGAK